MNFKFSLIKLISNQLRFKYTSARSSKTNHYNSLGISPKSTQGEIKTAYYKLSMIYHPDKNKDDDVSLQKFRNITEAYEVLGNVKTRKMYDKGLYFRSTVLHDDTGDKLYKSREVRSRPPPPDGRTPVYDFDEWAKSHYGSTFQRKMENKRLNQQYQTFQEKTVNDQKLERVVFVLFIIIFLCMASVNKQNFDHFTVGDHTEFVKKQTKD